MLEIPPHWVARPGGCISTISLAVPQQREQQLLDPGQLFAINSSLLLSFDYSVNMATTWWSEASTQPKQRITTIALAILAIVFLLLRLTARHMKRIGLGVDDWTLIVGLVGFVSI